jgi:[ribulose-bisphosphate carboxylase]-lysine N-methyltransferase
MASVCRLSFAIVYCLSAWSYTVESFLAPQFSNLKPLGVSTLAASSTAEVISNAASSLENSLAAVQKDICKTLKVTVAPSSVNRLGLVATEKIRKGEVFLAMPYDVRYELSADLARNVVFKDVLSEDYSSWTGDAGLIALLILNEVCLAADTGLGTKEPIRQNSLQAFMSAWVAALPGPEDINHPLLWSEEDQEILQSSSTNRIYRVLDDIEEDVTWLKTNVFEKDGNRFPVSIPWNGEEIPCFSLTGFKWAMALAQSRSFFVDNAVRLLPLLDFCNHADEGTEEARAGFMGTFGTTKGAELVAGQSYEVGEEVFICYGPKSAADYLLEHAFCPEQSWKTAVSELFFEVDPKDRFYDDKLDILEFETYDASPMDPVQSFDVVSAPGRDGEPDPFMVQFVRLCKLGATDAFLLESIFRKEVWGFMELPVSETNERDVVDAIMEACQLALDDFSKCAEGGPEICSKLRESESQALIRTRDFLRRDREALDLKEYYQQRRLKDLGLDSEWSPEDDMSPDLGFGQSRAPGGADYDW